ncbi:hypothetical protein [Flavobacterium sp.]|uniref:hypothetical protein n=1 Tax=Flavobacterium sp. TaxID=239 RepID=UPI00286D1E29|nr:hypothetical protein [Flavobacterium sp.]
MKHSLLNDLDANYIVIILFFIMLVAVWIGFKLGYKKTKSESRNPELLSSLLGLFALLLAFTFGMAGSRYENRKSNIIEEANAIGTAILRADIYPDSIKTAFKKDFEIYLNSRIIYFTADRNETKINNSLKISAAISANLWSRASFLAKDKNYFIQTNMMVPALNDMYDLASKANTVYTSKVPESIVYLLLIFSIIISFYVGYNAGLEKKLCKKHIVGFCFLTCLVIYITLDLDRPRRGLINLGDEIVLLKELKQNF